jgi:hypothetical protein
LAARRCDVVQGYRYAPAMSPEGFERWLLDHVAEQVRMMLRSVDEARSPPASSLLIASTGG